MFSSLLPKEGGETHIQIPCALRTRETPHVRLKYCAYMYGTRVGRSASSTSNVNTRECSKTPNPCWGMALAQQTDGLVAPEIPHQTSPTSSWQLDSTVDQGPFFAWQPSPSTHTTSNSYIAARHTGPGTSSLLQFEPTYKMPISDATGKLFLPCASWSMPPPPSFLGPLTSSSPN